MKHELLQIDLTLDEAERLQEKYSQKLKHQEHKILNILDIKEINWVVGVDISYCNASHEEWGVACAVLWSLDEKKMKSYKISKGIVKFPYKTGFLGFRECNLIAQALEKLNPLPDIIMCDGHGVIHPKRFGEAVQLGFALDIPTIGVAKSPFVGFTDLKNFERKKGNKVPIWALDPKLSPGMSQELLGSAVCLNDDMKPVFISAGYKTTLNIAIETTLKTTISHRQPEPLYLSDKISKQCIKNRI
jgi:deoxyribonuclease V